MDAHVLSVRLSSLSFELPQADVVRFHMMSGKTSLKLLHASRYPSVKPKNVEAFFKSHSKESLSSFH